jgi:hypothetical protein
VRWVKHDRKWFVFAVKFFVPPVFQLHGDSFNVSDLNLGLGFDARGVIITQTLIRHLHFRLGGMFRDAFGMARSSRICKVCKESQADLGKVLAWSRPRRNSTRRTRLARIANQIERRQVRLAS